MKQQVTNRRPQSGTTMIEVLITILVMSVGLLGLAGLFANSIKSTNEGYLYSQVVALAYDMADRIRANPSVLSNYGQTPPTTINKDCYSTTCTPSELAEFDLFEWNNRIDSNLPSATPSITINGNNATVQIQWSVMDQTNTFSVDVAL